MQWIVLKLMAGILENKELKKYSRKLKQPMLSLI
jgi:hypothetical protein